MSIISMDHLLNIEPPLPLPLPAPSTTTGNLKLRASTEAVLKARHLLHAFVVKHAGRLAGALAGASSALLGLLNAKTGLVASKLRRRSSSTKATKKSKEPCCPGGGGGNATPTQYLNLLPDGAVPSWSLGEPSPTEAAGGVACYYYDPSWNTVIPAEQLSPMIAGRCLEWPEEDGVEEEGGCNEIDRLAERFIARCHERFVLEKQASFRRFQEMLARSF
ncbi:hypothetical protein CFC21_065501 [Triticum aestivum]|uniref:Uncharacterized protein n=2 Tax=Triticum aestivum TaxID=4565 RepID=A0A3B6KEL6_WHEAT|nr:hypothetical protein CFC21_065501 [Triticum aestivum]